MGLTDKQYFDLQEMMGHFFLHLTTKLNHESFYAACQCHECSEKEPAVLHIDVGRDGKSLYVRCHCQFCGADWKDHWTFDKREKPDLMEGNFDKQYEPDVIKNSKKG